MNIGLQVDSFPSQQGFVCYSFNTTRFAYAFTQTLILACFCALCCIDLSAYRHYYYCCNNFRTVPLNTEHTSNSDLIIRVTIQLSVWNGLFRSSKANELQYCLPVDVSSLLVGTVALQLIIFVQCACF